MMMNNEEIVFEYLKDENANAKPIVVVSFNRPHVRNAISSNNSRQLVEHLNAIKSDPKIRCLILRSLVRGVFSSGADLKERYTMTTPEIIGIAEMLRANFTQIQQLSIPTIAAMDGYALGGGLEIALACDIRVASSDARMGLVETALANIPGAGGTQRLPRLIPVHLAKEMIFTSKVIDGVEAKAIGLVNIVVDQNDNGDAAYLRALQLANEIIDKNNFKDKNIIINQY